MGPKEIVVLTLTGFVLWAAATAFYGAFGVVLVERSFGLYALNCALAAVAFGTAFRVIVHSRRVEPRLWLIAAATFALPGLAAELVMLANLNTVFVDADPAALGRYAGFAAFVFLALPAFSLPPAPAQTRAEARAAIRASRR